MFFVSPKEAVFITSAMIEVSLHSTTVKLIAPSATRIFLPGCTDVGRDLYEHAK
jgi:hypothetical protein